MTTYYVDGAVGNDANAGTSEGSGNAWATIDKAMNTVAAGDKVWVKASASYDENGNIDTAGTITAPITFEGYTSTTGDNGKVTWTNSSGVALTDTTSFSYYIFKNFKFTGCSSSGVSISSAFKFYNCEFTSNGANGAFFNSYSSFVNCLFANNSTVGLNTSAASYINVIGCLFYGNTNAAIYGTGQNIFIDSCVFYSPGASNHGIDCSADYTILSHCTFDGDGSTGFGVNAAGESYLAVVSNIIYDYDEGYRCYDTAQAVFFTCVAAYNLMNTLPTGAYRTNSADITGLEYGYQDVTSAPAFTDEANDDYTLGATSPAIDAGIMPGCIT